MDPEANLQEQDRIVERRREIARLDRLARQRRQFDRQRLADLKWQAQGDRQRLIELREALAGWLASGGFRPTWSKYPAAAAHYWGDVKNAPR